MWAEKFCFYFIFDFCFSPFPFWMTQMWHKWCVFQDCYFKKVCFIWIVIYNSECIYNETQNNENCSTVLYSWLTPTCVIKKKPFVLSCLFFFLFFSGIVFLRCFGHVYKLDCEQLKLVCQSMETWLQITLLFHTVKVRLGNVGVSRGKRWHQC